MADNPTVFAEKWVQTSCLRVVRGLEIILPPENEYLETVSFVQQMLKILDDIAHLSNAIGACDEEQERIKYNIKIYQKMLKSLYDKQPRNYGN